MEYDIYHLIAFVLGVFVADQIRCGINMPDGFTGDEDSACRDHHINIYPSGFIRTV